MPQVTAAEELQIKAEARLAALMEEKLVTRISVLSTLLGGGKTTERLFVRISIETHKTSPDFDQTAADKAKNRIKQALGEIGCDVFSGVYKITQLLPSKAMIVNIASRAPMSRMSGPSRKANSSAICDPVAALSFRPAREAR